MPVKMHPAVCLILEVLRILQTGLIYSIQSAIKFLLPPPPKSLRNQIILVTGGANGIGREILVQLAHLEPEATLISWDTDEVANKSLIEDLNALGVKKALWYTVDVSDASRVSQVARDVLHDVGHVTMLFNNAGICGPLGKSWELDLEDVKKTLEIDLLSHLYVNREFLPDMIKHNAGHIVSTCSVLGLVYYHTGSPYVVAKHALKALYECLKEDLRRYHPEVNIPVTIVFPSIVTTRLTKAINLYCKNFPSFTQATPAALAAEQIINGVRRDYEYVYIPPYWRLLHFAASFQPTKVLQVMNDLVNIDPTAGICGADGEYAKENCGGDGEYAKENCGGNGEYAQENNCGVHERKPEERPKAIEFD